MSEALPTALIFRRDLLGWSETFIPRQVRHYLRYRPVYAGLSRVVGGADLEMVPTSVLADSVRAGRLRSQIARRVGWYPSAWIRRLATWQPKILHAHFGPDGLAAMGLAKRLKVPLVVTFHGFDATVVDPERMGSSRTRRRARVYLKKLHELFSYAEGIIAVSQFIRECLIGLGCPPTKVLVIPLGIDCDEFTPDLPTSDPRVLFIGRLMEKKGCAHLLRAMKQVQTHMPSAELVIVGDGPLRGSLEQQAYDDQVRVTFCGRQTPVQVREWLIRSQLVAVPSITAANGDAEGLPTVVMEALAMGIPVVGSKHAGIPEAVRHGETGLLSSEGDESGLAENLLQLLGDHSRRHGMGVMAAADMRDRFSQNRLVERLESLYDRLQSRFD